MFRSQIKEVTFQWIQRLCSLNLEKNMKLPFHLLQRIPKPMRKGNVKLFIMTHFYSFLKNNHVFRCAVIQSLNDKSTCFTLPNRYLFHLASDFLLLFTKNLLNQLTRN